MARTKRGNREIVRVPYAELRDGDRDGDLGVGRRVVGKPRPIGGGKVELVLRWDTGKPDRATPEAHRTARVARVTVGPGQAVRYRTRNPVTGATIEVLDTGHADSPVRDYHAGGHKWALRCSHGTVTGRRTRAQAEADVERVTEWCTPCRVAAPALLPL